MFEVMVRETLTLTLEPNPQNEIVEGHNRGAGWPSGLGR